MSQIIYPLLIDFESWASQMRRTITTIAFPLPFPVEQWHDWAAQVININNLQSVPLPSKDTYPKTEDWSKWAAFFVNYLIK